MPNTKPLHEMFELNEELPCSVEGCKNKRYKLYSTCLKHRQRVYKYGHPKALSISRKAMKAELKQVRNIVLKNRDTHPGLNKAIKWFDKWLLDASLEMSGVPGQYHFKRLYDHGISGEELLVVTAAVFIYSYRNPSKLPSDSKYKEAAVEFAMAHQTTKLIPLEYMTTASGKKRAKFLSKKDRSEIGKYIYDTVGLLYLKMVRSLDRKNDEQQTWKKEMQMDFNVA